MNADREFSPGRFWAIIVKEFIQMRRDRLTFLMMIGIPVLQLVLFGYAINSDPKHLPSAVVAADDGPQARALLFALKNSAYFDFVRQAASEEEARSLLDAGKVQFVVSIPAGFTRSLLRGDSPPLLLEADASDPSASVNALLALRTLAESALQQDLHGPLSFLTSSPAAVPFRVHAAYNPEGLSRYNIVPGLMGVVLTMTMVIITALAITRERESGTMENVLAMPTRPFEVLIGKIVPYILVGFIQIVLILLMARFVFRVPMIGSLVILFAAALVFIAANLAVGVTFSTIAKNQRQALQMAIFFFLPSILLSGFMFPFRGMPWWAQAVGEILPLTHFLRIVRGILLKGNGAADVVQHLWQIALFAAAALSIAVKSYRMTLD